MHRRYREPANLFLTCFSGDNSHTLPTGLPAPDQSVFLYNYGEQRVSYARDCGLPVSELSTDGIVMEVGELRSRHSP